MSAVRRLSREQTAYRVRVVQTGTAEHNEGRIIVKVTRTYDTLGAARGQATQTKNQAKRYDKGWNTVVTVERATGWETV